MLARICDRCGTPYKQYGMANNSKNANGLRLLNIDSKGTAYCHDFIDLCPDCMKKLYEFLKGASND